MSAQQLLLPLWMSVLCKAQLLAPGGKTEHPSQSHRGCCHSSSDTHEGTFPTRQEKSGGCPHPTSLGLSSEPSLGSNARLQLCDVTIPSLQLGGTLANARGSGA